MRLALAGDLVPDAVNVAGGRVNEDVRPGIPLIEKLGRIVSSLVKDSLTAVEITVAGEIANHDVKVLELAALKGIFSGYTSEQVSYVNAPVLAEQRGVAVNLKTTTESDAFRNKLTVLGATSSGKQVSVTGTLTGPRQIQKLIGVDDYELEVPLTEHMLFIRYQDRPGVIGELGQTLGSNKVNIAGMQVSRNVAGDALAVLTLDSTSRRVSTPNSRTRSTPPWSLRSTWKTKSSTLNNKPHVRGDG